MNDGVRVKKKLEELWMSLGCPLRPYRSFRLFLFKMGCYANRISLHPPALPINGERNTVEILSFQKSVNIFTFVTLDLKAKESPMTRYPSKAVSLLLPNRLKCFRDIQIDMIFDQANISISTIVCHSLLI